MADQLNPREFTSTGQALDASDSAKDAAARVPDANINPPVEDGNANENIVVTAKDKSIEASKQSNDNANAESSEGKK